jgi:hypothetical protein
VDHQEDPSRQEATEEVLSDNNGHERDDSRPTNGRYGKLKFSRMVRMFREGFLSVTVYKTAYERATFHDVVIYRKVRVRGGNFDYRRGANLKPSDIPVLQKLLVEVNDYFKALSQDEPLE